MQQYLEYLRDNWPEKVGNRFLQQLDKNLGYLSTAPDMFPVFRNNNRKCKLDAHTSLYFEISGNSVEILYLQHHARNPGRMLLE